MRLELSTKERKVFRWMYNSLMFVSMISWLVVLIFAINEKLQFNSALNGSIMVLGVVWGIGGTALFLIYTIEPDTDWNPTPNILNSLYFMITNLFLLPTHISKAMERRRRWKRFKNDVVSYDDFYVMMRSIVYDRSGLDFSQFRTSVELRIENLTEEIKKFKGINKRVKNFDSGFDTIMDEISEAKKKVVELNNRLNYYIDTQDEIEQTVGLLEHNQNNMSRRMRERSTEKHIHKCTGKDECSLLFDHEWEHTVDDEDCSLPVTFDMCQNIRGVGNLNLIRKE